MIPAYLKIVNQRAGNGRIKPLGQLAIAKREQSHSALQHVTIESVNPERLAWQSKLVLLLVVPAAAVDAALQTEWWGARQPTAAVWTLGLSLLLGLVTWQLRAATAGAAAAGAAITASLMDSTFHYPYTPWHTALIPVLAVSLLAFASTRLGREKKERLGAAERREGRAASQVAANLGFAALVSSQFAQSWAAESGRFAHATAAAPPLLVAGLAALAEAAADTVSSEVGQVFGGRPRMLTTLRAVDAGTDGAVSVVGTLAGVAAAAIVAAVGTWALNGDGTTFAVSWGGAAFGLVFDSLLGATAELAGALNNDAVNFLSTGAAAGFALAVMGLLR